MLQSLPESRVCAGSPELTAQKPQHTGFGGAIAVGCQLTVNATSKAALSQPLRTLDRKLESIELTDPAVFARFAAHRIDPAVLAEVICASTVRAVLHRAAVGIAPLGGRLLARSGTAIQAAPTITFGTGGRLVKALERALATRVVACARDARADAGWRNNAGGTIAGRRSTGLRARNAAPRLAGIVPVTAGVVDTVGHKPLRLRLAVFIPR